LARFHYQIFGQIAMSL